MYDRTYFVLFNIWPKLFSFTRKYKIIIINNNSNISLKNVIYNLNRNFIKIMIQIQYERGIKDREIRVFKNKWVDSSRFLARYVLILKVLCTWKFETNLNIPVSSWTAGSSLRPLPMDASLGHFALLKLE